VDAVASAFRGGLAALCRYCRNGSSEMLSLPTNGRSSAAMKNSTRPVDSDNMPMPVRVKGRRGNTNDGMIVSSLPTSTTAHGVPGTRPLLASRRARRYLTRSFARAPISGISAISPGSGRVDLGHRVEQAVEVHPDRGTRLVHAHRRPLVIDDGARAGRQPEPGLQRLRRVERGEIPARLPWSCGPSSRPIGNPLSRRF
jgi:hypothetical protein